MHRQDALLNVYQDARGAITVILVFLVITKGGSKESPFSICIEFYFKAGSERGVLDGVFSKLAEMEENDNFF